MIAMFLYNPDGVAVQPQEIARQDSGVKHDVMRDIAQDLSWGSVLQALMTDEPQWQDSSGVINVVGGPDDTVLAREMDIRDQALASLGMCDLQLETSWREMVNILASDDYRPLSPGSSQRECIGGMISIESAADICCVKVSLQPLEFHSRIGMCARAIRIAGNSRLQPTLPTLFARYDFTEDFYARDACLLCFVLADHEPTAFADLFQGGAAAVDRLCGLVSKVCGDCGI